jgi:2-oxoglutarate dehydrogenase E2 component (dihydrolipoamide succinyltransferase)
MSTTIEVRAPAEQTEGTRSQLLRWLKQPGDAVIENEPLIEIETDKVTVEVAAPASGVLREILKHEQDEIAPGELLGRIESSGAAASTAAAPKHADTPAPAGGAQGVADAAAGMRPGIPAAGSRGASGLSPAVRRLLAEHGLESSAVRGSGSGGRVTVEDVLAAAASKSGATASARPRVPAEAANQDSAAAPGAAGPTHAAPQGAVRRVPHTAVRKRIAEHMVQSLLHTAPHVTAVFEADLSAVLQDRARQRDDFARRGVSLTLTAYFVQAAVAAIRAVPEANSRWTDTALEIYDSIHVGVGTAVEGTGLVAPVLRDAQTLDLFNTARGLADLVTRARAGKLTPPDMRGGTFTISNHGVSGSLLAAPIIINQPQAAILGVGKLEKRAVVVEEGGESKIVVRPRCYVTLTLDHRVMDGDQANHFMRVLVQRLNDWPA